MKYFLVLLVVLMSCTTVAPQPVNQVKSNKECFDDALFNIQSTLGKFSCNPTLLAAETSQSVTGAYIMVSVFACAEANNVSFLMIDMKDDASRAIVEIFIKAKKLSECRTVEGTRGLYYDLRPTEDLKQTGHL